MLLPFYLALHTERSSKTRVFAVNRGEKRMGLNGYGSQHLAFLTMSGSKMTVQTLLAE